MAIIQYFPVSSGCGGSGTASTPSASASSVTPPMELHVCMGLNACRGHDRFGTNACAGMGYCATAATHVCHTLNNCRGQGGCGLYGDGHEQMKPGANDCAWQGSCAVPIQAERFSTQGENTGKSTWKLARKLFEERMKKSNRDFGNAPDPCGPKQNWLTSVSATGSYDSCGNSGNKYCSFGFNNPNDNSKKLCNGEVITITDGHKTP
jgi:hypothetical protein